MGSIEPIVSVIMPVYNGERYLGEAIDSILNQTFTDFELLIINDGSTDGSVDIIDSYSDPRIRLIHNDKNLELSATLNKGLDMARGKYLARMDCDDICLPRRLEKQVAFMDSNREVGICGSWIKTIGIDPNDIWKHPIEPEEIRATLLFESVLAHPSTMMRKEFMEKYKLKYNPNYSYYEDYDLWHRAVDNFPLMNLNEVLLLYRITPESLSHRNRVSQIKVLELIYSEAFSRLGLSPTTEEMNIHKRIGAYDFEKSHEFIEEAGAWLLKLINANTMSKVYQPDIFKNIIGRRWFSLCNESAQLGLRVWWAYNVSPVRDKLCMQPSQEIKFFVKCALKYGERSA